MKKLLPLLILISLVSAQEPAESLIDSIATGESGVMITDIYGNKVRGTLIDSTDTEIALSIEGTGQIMYIPKGSVNL
jgi:hypothetical protein